MNEDVENNNEEETAPKQQEDPVAKFDLYRKQREYLINRVKTLVESGEKLNQKKLSTVLKSLINVDMYQEQLIRSLLADLVQASSYIINQQQTLVTVSVQLKSLLTHLEDKEIVNQEELKKIAEERVIPEAEQELKESMKEHAKEQLEEETKD